LVAANELSLQELIPYLESFLIKNKANWMEENFDLIYQTCFKTDSFMELQKYCTGLISKEPNKIFNSLNFSLIPEKLLITLIQNENHQMSEIQVWERIIEWGRAQNPDLSSDPTNYSKDDFNVLKNTLQHCIPLIKFRNLTSKEFSKKVLPYKKILPKELYKDLLEYFLDNDSSPVKKSRPRPVREINVKANNVDSKKAINIDSKIIEFQHAELISKWIDKLEITDKLSIPYGFKLLYRESRDASSRDGSGGLLHRFKNFHEICKNQSRTVTIIKVKDSNEILGGYNPIEWKFDGSYGVANDSFIFSFGNNNIENYILSRVNDETKAIYNDFYNGPSFGHGDLYLCTTFGGGLKIICKKRYYEKQIIESNDALSLEFEVFQIV
jgi:hypothetical protein